MNDFKFESEHLEDFKRRFKIIKNKGFIQSSRTSNTGIGKTFEDLLEKKEDNLSEADFGDIEIKTQRERSNSYVTLFTKSPTYPRAANTHLRLNYGTEDSGYGLKILHTSIFGNKYNTFADKYGFKFIVDREKRIMFISIKELSSGLIIDESAYYSFDLLEQAISKKLKKVAYVTAESREGANGEEFYYKSVELLYRPNFDKFICLIEDGTIMIDIRIGVFHNKEKRTYGKTHDHGTGFRIKESDFDKLFISREIVE